MVSHVVSGFCDPCFSKIEAVFRHSIESQFEVGASVAIEYEGKLVVDLWGGYKDAKRTQLWQQDTLVNVWSVTKGITAICAAQLIEQGRLDINQKVSFYWPEYGCNGKENTTILDLMCHRAGMFGFQDDIPQNEWQDWQKFTDLLAHQAPFVEPSSIQGYHAITFGWLVGEIIRRIDGRSVGTYFKEEIAIPLGLDFTIGLAESDLSRCADTLLLDSLPSFAQLALLRYIPNFLLPQLLKDVKHAATENHNAIAFDASLFEDVSFVNSNEWRMAEVPAANGHGVASSLATLYGILSTGGSRDGIDVLQVKTIDLLRQVHSSGPDMVLFGLPYRFGLGHMVNAPLTPIGRQKSMFGHTGVGGAVAFGDVDKKLGFSFFNNQQHQAVDLYKTANNLSKALYSLI
ncbi:MAG TPA: serine hydrolase [Porticoccaceae bacterium]|jgi:CubicO group peptidase (beta-lactamase class C family)|nr:serine hydrolase [Porticoccaceae bacterium]